MNVMNPKADYGAMDRYWVYIYDIYIYIYIYAYEKYGNVYMNDMRMCI